MWPVRLSENLRSCIWTQIFWRLIFDINAVWSLLPVPLWICIGSPIPYSQRITAQTLSSYLVACMALSLRILLLRWNVFDKCLFQICHVHVDLVVSSHRSDWVRDPLLWPVLADGLLCLLICWAIPLRDWLGYFVKHSENTIVQESGFMD